jgi:hypothetical protein
MGVAIGAVVNYGVGSGFAAIPCVKKVTLNTLEGEEINIDCLDNADLGHVTEVGMIEPGMIEVECRYTDELFALFYGQLFEPNSWQVISNGGTGIETEGWLKSCTSEMVATNDDQILKLVFRCTGLPDLVQPAP